MINFSTIKNVIQKNQIQSVLILVFLIGLIGLILDANETVFGQSSLLFSLSMLLRGMGAELCGMSLSVFIIDRLYEKRQQKQYKEQLIRQMGSRHNETVDIAVAELRANGKSPESDDSWLTDGSLKGHRFYKANFQGVNLAHSDLSDSNLIEADLRGVNLFYANLVGASLLKADFRGNQSILGGANFEKSVATDARFNEASMPKAIFLDAILINANFNNATLSEADFRGANLTHATFEGAWLQSANFENALNATALKLSQAQRIENAIMPDGTLVKDWGEFNAWVKSKL